VNRVVAIIQARMGSTRLPGKVMMPLAGEPMLARVVERVRRTVGIDETVVATSVLPEEQPLVALCRRLDVRCVRGSALDVLARYHQAAVESAADTIIRITSDCPLISPAVTGRVLAAFREGGSDYCSNCHQRTYPRGLDTEVFSRAALELAAVEAREPSEREHVTPFIWRRPERFRLAEVVDQVDRSSLRWTVDTPDDYVLTQRIYDAFLPHDPTFDYAEVVSLLDRHPDWSSLNAHIEQKKVGS
jgi:spore coat polysaccharide biosynthesis protein SpsF